MPTNIFLLADIISRGRGSFEDRFESSYAMPRAILIGSLFMFGVFSVTGLPPLSGFFCKLLILKASLDHQWFGLVLGVVLVASFLMIITMARTGSQLFYDVLPVSETDDKSNNNEISGESPNRVSIIAVIILFAMSPLLVLFAQPITAFTESAAKQQLDSKRYIESVLSKQAVEAEKE